MSLFKMNLQQKSTSGFSGFATDALIYIKWCPYKYNKEVLVSRFSCFKTKITAEKQKAIISLLIGPFY